MAHPECNKEVQEIADVVGSTSAMIKFGKETIAKTIIVATEKGLVDRSRKEIYSSKGYCYMQKYEEDHFGKSSRRSLV